MYLQKVDLKRNQKREKKQPIQVSNDIGKKKEFLIEDWSHGACSINLYRSINHDFVVLVKFDCKFPPKLETFVNYCQIALNYDE